MEARPPRSAERWLTLALGEREETTTILGDLSEDFTALARARGRRHATLWYWRQALGIGLPALFERLFTRRPRHENRGREESEMRDSLGTIGLVQDLRYALRAVRRDPMFFVFATAIIALGVGASTAVFSVTSPLLLQPLPFHEPERLVLIEHDGEGGGLSAVTSRTGNLRDIRERARSFDGLAGFNAFFEQRSYNLVGAGEPERLVAVDVTNDFLDVLGVEPVLGRNFDAEEGRWDGPAAVILTHGFWQRRFAGDPGIVGTSLTLNDRPWQVIGVLPPSFDFSSVFSPTIPVDFLRAWPIGEETDRQGNTTTIVGRLRPGVSVEVAQAELESILQALAAEDPNRWGLGARSSHLQERIARPFRAGMLLLAAAAGLVMLIVCLNLSNMLLARSPRRRREMAVRRSLGATAGRLVRQLVLESLLVSFAGAVLGVGIALAATRFVAGTQGLDIPMLSTVGVDGAALLFTAAVALVAGIAVGVVPALQAAGGDASEAFGGTSRGSSAGRRGRRLRELLVVGEVAMACVLLVLGGLVMRSFQRVMDVELGFEARNALAWQVRTTRPFDTLPEVVAFYDEVVSAVEAVPGVETAGLIDALPLGRHRTWGTRVIGIDYEEDEGHGFFPHIVDPRYLDAMGIPLVEGRNFTADDTQESAWVALVNETATRQMFPDGQAIGRAIRMWYGEVEIVGVVADVKHEGLDLSAGNEIYFPMAQVWDFNTLDLVVRSELPPTVIAPSVAAAIETVDPQMPTEDYRSLEAVVERSVSPRRFTLQLLGTFALTALLLAALGIYGVLSYSVTERLPEIGIRMALGESAGEVRRRVVGRTMLLAVAGIVIGTVASITATRYIASLLYGVEPTDPSTFLAMIAILLATAAVSGLVPAIRASRTDSAEALRGA